MNYEIIEQLINNREDVWVSLVTKFTATNTNANSYFGISHPTRKLIIWSTKDGSGVQTCTVDGNAANNYNSANNNDDFSQSWWFDYGAGNTTGNIHITNGGTNSRKITYVFAVYNAKAGAPLATYQDTGNANSSLVITTIPAGGAVTSAFVQRVGSERDTTWTGLNEVDEGVYGFYDWGAALANFVSGGANTTVSFTRTGTGTRSPVLMCTVYAPRHDPMRLSALITGGTNIGNMTAESGLAAAFDASSNTAYNGTASRGAASGQANAYIGKTTTKRVFKALVAGSNDRGYVNAINPNMTLTLYGKTGTAPASGTDGTSLGSITFADTAMEGVAREIISNNNEAIWNHIWLYITHDGAVNHMYCGDLQLYESL
jgi:hypothetical protein